MQTGGSVLVALLLWRCCRQMLWQVLIVSVILAARGGTDCARILALLPTTARSHWIVMEPFLQELAAKGHQLTVFTTFPQAQPLPNFTDVDFSYKLPTLVNAMSLDRIKETMPHPWRNTIFINQVGKEMCTVIKEPVFQQVFKNKYDLVITELFGTDCMTYVAYKLKTPFISITTTMSAPWAAERLGLPDNPSYIPNFFVSFSPDMSLWQRTYNTVVLLYAKFMYLWVFSEQTRSQVEEYFQEPLPPLQEVVANTSLVLVNSYHYLAQSRPFPPNVIEVGGIHIKQRQQLPQDLQTILDSSPDGVIVMSFGSLVRSATLPKSFIAMFMNVFSNIPQTVIFKYEEDLPEVPSNVVVRKWLPQRDMIEHKNVIAVIIHGGLASTIEAVYFGKPIIGIPFFGDQYRNIRSVVERGGGVQLDMDRLSESSISAAVKEITTNPKYTEGMKKLSQKYRDRPMTALQSAVYWTEYVIRHKGAPHLQPASVRLPLYQYLLLDVIVVLLLIFSTIVLATYYTIKYFCMFICGPRVKKYNNTKKYN